jgi:hypothetical protein
MDAGQDRRGCKGGVDDRRVGFAGAGGGNAVIRLPVERVIFGGISGARGRSAPFVSQAPPTVSIGHLGQQIAYWFR